MTIIISISHVCHQNPIFLIAPSPLPPTDIYLFAHNNHKLVLENVSLIEKKKKKQEKKSCIEGNMSALISGVRRLQWKFTGATHECLNVFNSLWCCWCLWAAADGGGRRLAATAFMIWMSGRIRPCDRNSVNGVQHLLPRSRWADVFNGGNFSDVWILFCYFLREKFKFDRCSVLCAGVSWDPTCSCESCFLTLT